MALISNLDKIRIDKWLWSVRIFKTRSISKNQCNGGKIKINGKNVKPSSFIKINDEIEVQKNTIKFIYKVLKITEKRISPKDVNIYVDDLTSENEIFKKNSFSMIKIYHRKKGLGRPTKKERRSMEKTNKFYNK
tara:strand:- start:5324 stop:5725 length:402 start_codon:yes stop_codon:yes gene_type:complete